MQLMSKDALLIVDVQNDFLPGGSLAVPKADEIIPVLNRYIAQFVNHSLPVYATRDWHPADHCSFQAQGGPWPSHCIANTAGARFAANLNLPSNVLIVSKAAMPQKDAYSGFEGTDLARRLRSQGVERLFIGGLATDYCVLNTVRDALAGGFAVFFLRDAVRAVDVHLGDGEAAISEMIAGGAYPVRYEDIAESTTHSLP